MLTLYDTALDNDDFRESERAKLIEEGRDLITEVKILDATYGLGLISRADYDLKAADYMRRRAVYEEKRALILGIEQRD
jgi:hypothetical protein